MYTHSYSFPFPCRAVALPVLYLLHCLTEAKFIQSDSESDTKLAVPLFLIEKQVI